MSKNCLTRNGHLLTFGAASGSITQWLDFIGLPTNPGSTGPWVMWKGTPYAHLMIPMERAGIANAPR